VREGDARDFLREKLIDKTMSQPSRNVGPNPASPGFAPKEVAAFR